MADTTQDGGEPTPASAEMLDDGYLQVVQAPGGKDERPCLDDVLPRIAELIASAVGANRSATYVFDDAITRTVAAHRFGYSLDPPLVAEDVLRDNPWDIPVASEILRTHQPVQRREAADFARLSKLGEDVRAALGRRCDLTVPLLWHDSVVGATSLWRTDDPRPFTEAEIRVVQVMANLAAGALAVARLQEAERAREQRYQALNRAAMLRVSRLLTAQRDLQAALEVIAAELAKIIPHDHCLILEADEAARTLHPRHFWESAGPVPLDWKLAFGEGICGAVALSQRPEILNQAHRDPRTRYRTEATDRRYRQHGQSVLVAPLEAEGHILGVLYVGRVGSDRFTWAEFETFQVFAGQAAAAMYQASLSERNHMLYRASVEVLAATVDAKDPTTLEHSRNVAHYAHLAGEAMGLSPQEIEQLELAGLLHDIGKVGVPDRILRKPGKLDPDERRIMMGHADRGADILAEHPALRPLVPLVRHHHEWHDGRGYPAGLAGDAIPLGAAIIAVADAFDTMTSERPYHRRRTLEAALEELNRCAGSQFHPEIVARFTATLKAHPEWSRAKPGGDEAASPVSQLATTEIAQIQILHQIGEEIGHLTDLYPFLERVRAILAAQISTSELAILLRDDETGDLILGASTRYPDFVGHFHLPAGGGICGRAMTSGKLCLVPDVRQAPEFINPRGHPVTAELVVPLLFENRPMGVILVDRDEPAPFTPRDESLLVAVAGQLAPVVRVAQLYDREIRATSADALTGLPNHRALHRALETALEDHQRTHQPLSIAMWDIENMRLINATLGDHVGDQVLRSLASQLRALARRQHLVGRFGGDQFVVIMPETGEAEAVAMAAAQTGKFALPIDPSLAHAARLHFGVAVAGIDGTRADALIAAAEWRVRQARLPAAIQRVEP